MRLYLLIFSVLVIIAASSCKHSRPEINLGCTEDDLKNYQVKWEIYPRLEGTAKVYISNSPTDFSNNELIASVNIADGATSPIVWKGTERLYFKVVFNDRFSQTVATRVLNINGINNFRDIGGYENREQKFIKWGTIFRSGYLHGASPEGKRRINSLKINTAIEFRNNYEDKCINTPGIHIADTIVCINEWIKRDELIHKLSKGSFKRGDGILYMQDCYLHYLTSEKEMINRAFKTFADSSKYPLLMVSNLGKDQTGFITALLLKLAGIPDKVIIKDYLLSNENISRQGLAKYTTNIPDDSLEGFAMLFSARPEYLQCLFKRIDSSYGGIDSYLIDHIGLTKSELKSIRNNILTNKHP